ncbi:uncharacterized protein PFL1_04394 [Pseudozyma flocculosa PF-1]|uniref:Related to ITC1 - subunit of Isw2 chromatin remodelling complex n=2 Tax=Pseudozyma flocculosa TaxID=84751 RepID=A0A5C3FFQ9_9BASI|nr:uncharacterized protein PFL1_04394 [Pseudozyma flocculosa PF-1]EPQ28067.1 hypothetical protein PFL1_04394 [Pseudozyma flocculosa PF-1]SPO42189.1 related to ITC1 - subunit of Isw2 chromatin remodelling complex [Pseudozyma flocculosa]
MPLVKRKIVEMAPPPKAKGSDDPEVFYLDATGEIFSDYDAYVKRLTFYNQRFFQCELTGRVNLTFFEAAESEKQESITLHKKFPEPLKGPVLRSVQFKVTGRLDNLVDLVFDRFKDRFFANEAVFVELQGDRYYARIKEVFPPKSVLKTHQDAHSGSGSPAKAGPSNGVKHEDAEAAALASDSALDGEEAGAASAANKATMSTADVIHRLGVDLTLGPAQANALDDPTQYIYRIQLVDDEGSFTGSLMEASADRLSRDRLTFSKTILRKYIRDCVVRDASVGAPWTVKTWLAEKYDIPTRPSDELVQQNESIRDAKLLKRKKLLAEAEESSAKKKAKTSAASKKAEATEAKKSAAAEKKRLADEEKAKEEERLKAERERKKQVKYPIEDLDLDPITPRELKFQVEGELPRRRQRPIPSRGPAALPVPVAVFEEFMVSYYFLVALGKPLSLSVFTLDDYEHALRHSTHEPPCALIAEIHAVLINTIVRDGSHSKDMAPAAIASRAGAREANGSVAPSENGDSVAGPSRAGSAFDEIDGDADGEGDRAANGNGTARDSTVAEILRAARELGRGSEKRLLRVEDGRAGWEAQLAALLARRSSPETCPRLVGILSHLTGIQHPEGHIDGQWIADTYTSVVERYPVLPLEDKIRIINLLCELTVMTKPVKAYFEECEAQVTELRKEKIELGRERKKLAEEREAFEGGQKKDDAKKEEDHAGEAEDGSTAMPVDEEGDEGDDDDDGDSEKDELESSDGDDDDGGGGGGRRGSRLSTADASDSGSDRFRRPYGSSSRQEKLRERAMLREAEEAARAASLAKEREAHRAKLAENKQINAARKRLDDEEAKLWKREEAIEREFRKVLLAPRMIPLGRDRFYARYWWFDGVGSTSLVGGGGSVLYQTGRIFVQGPSREEWGLALGERKKEHLDARKAEEIGPEGDLAVDEWGVYTETEQIDELLSWLRVKGHRENHLKSQLLKFRFYIQGGLRKRNADLQGGWRDQLETRRSSRSKSENAGSRRASYMAWRNAAAERDRK